jgi:hypothetical protein
VKHTAYVIDTTKGNYLIRNKCVCRVVSHTIKQISALVASAVSTIRTDADVATWRNVRFIREKKACQSNIANLRVLKLSLAVGTNKNPPGHLSTQMGGQRFAGSPINKKLSKFIREKQSGIACTTHDTSYEPVSELSVYNFLRALQEIPPCQHP